MPQPFRLAGRRNDARLGGVEDFSPRISFLCHYYAPIRYTGDDVYFVSRQNSRHTINAIFFSPRYYYFLRQPLSRRHQSPRFAMISTMSRHDAATPIAG